jgi:hypothetical protein
MKSATAAAARARSADLIDRYAPLLIAFNLAMLLIGSLFMADALTGSRGFNPDTWGQFAYSYPARMWAGIMICGSLMCVIGLVRPVQRWMVLVGAVVQFTQFAAIAYSAIFTGGEFVVGIYASILFMPLYFWLWVKALPGSAW